MKLPFKVPAIVLAALAALFMGFGSATVGTGVANANPWCGNHQVGWPNGGCNDQWNVTVGINWQGHGGGYGCGNNCGPGNWDQRVWKDGPPGLPPVLVEAYKVNWRWCPIWGTNDWELRPW